MGFVFNKCCCCIELRTGSLILGYLSLVGNALLTLAMIMGIAGSTIAINNDDNDETRKVHTFRLIIFCVVLLFMIVNLIFVIVLLVGLHKYKRGHVKAYIVYTCIFIVHTIIQFIIKLATQQSAVAIGDLFSIVMSTYFMLCIRSYYLKMNNGDKEPAIYTA